MRYFSCVVIVLGMMFCVSAYADEAPGQEPEPEVTEQVEQTPEPVETEVPVTEPPVSTSEPFSTPEPAVEPAPVETPEITDTPEPEVTADITPGNENGSSPGEIFNDNSTVGNQESFAPPPEYDGPMLIDASPEPSPMLVSEYQAQLLGDIEYIEGLICFIVVVILCYFSYKFFRIFF